ncbi:MAG: sigma-70 family RNA polymerase sigma factor [Clostridia bacterium]|nr:sigma-70 family RNA polymerase sigma factor [Clostridia bacterium]
MTSQKDIINIIVEEYSDMVYRIALMKVKTKEEAEDIYQEVFFKISQKMPKFKSEEHKKAWLIRVTINISNNYLKSAWKRKVVGLDENVQAEESNDISNVYSEVSKLPEDYKIVIYLYYYEGYKVSEISNILEKKENTVKTWLSRARELLRQKLEGGFDNE